MAGAIRNGPGPRHAAHPSWLLPTAEPPLIKTSVGYATEHGRHTMRSQAQILALTLVSLVVVTKGATAQQIFEDRTLGPNNIVLLAGQEAVQKDLMVSEDVARKLNGLAEEFRQAADNVNKDLGITTFNPRTLTAEQRDKYREKATSINVQFVPKVIELLSPDQMKRLRQIQFQLPFGTGAHQALMIPNVASALALSDEQVGALKLLQAEYRQTISSRTREPIKTYSHEETKKVIREYDEYREKLREDYTKQAIELLTPAQKAKLENLMGAPFDVSKVERN